MLFQIIRKSYVFFLFLSVSTFLHAQNELQHLDATLDSIFGQYNIGAKPGASIAIIENNKPTFLKSYGHANLEYEIKNTPNTLFNSADLAKQFTVFSILLLQEQGKLSIQDNIKKFVPQLNKWPFEITLKHLMEQTSGLRDVMELKKWTGYQNGDVVTKQDILDIISKQRRLNFPSGSTFEQNRTGFVLLTEVIAKVSGMPFSTFVQQHIFTPLGMNNSVFVNTHTELIKNRAYSYATTDKRFTKIINNSSFIGATNLYTSVSDFAKWLRNMSNHKIGKPFFYEYMQTKIKLPNGEKSNYTPGFYKYDKESYSMIKKESFDHGYTSDMIHIPKHEFSVVYFSNDIDFPVNDIHDAIDDWFMKDYNIPPAKSFNTNVKLVNKSAAALKKYTGNYLFEHNFSIRKIVLENDTLFYVRNENSRNPIVPIKGDHTFKMLVPGSDNIRVTFKNQGNSMEFKALSAIKDNEYATLSRKIEPNKEKQSAFSGDYRNEELGHTINVQSLNKEIQLTMDGTSIALDQIADNELSPSQNPKIGYVKLKRDKQHNIIGIYLSGSQLKNLYYKLENK